MNNILEKLHTASSKISLTQEERATIKSSIIREMQKHPYGLTETWTASFVRFVTQVDYTKVVAAGVASAILFTAGGISFAAESSLPGDTLYSVKTNFNEALIEALAVSDAGKAKVHTQFAEKRLTEAGQLASQKRLDPEKKKVISDKLKTHVTQAESKIDEIVAKKDYVTAVEVSSELETALRAHNDVLVALAEEDAVDATTTFAVAHSPSSFTYVEKSVRVVPDSPVTEVIEEVEETVALVMAQREMAEQQVADSTSPASTTEPVAELKMEEARVAVLKAESQFATARTGLRARIGQVSDAQIAAALEHLEDGAESLEDEEFEDAFLEFNNAVRLANEVVERMNAFSVFSQEDANDDADTATSTAATSTPTTTTSTTSGASIESGTSASSESTPVSNTSPMQSFTSSMKRFLK